jgi:hypothetical protein
MKAVQYVLRLLSMNDFCVDHCETKCQYNWNQTQLLPDGANVDI